MPPPRPSSPNRDFAWRAALLFAAVLLAYVPALRSGFVWDDDAHVTGPALRSAHGLWRIWFEVGATQQFYPLLHSAFWLEHVLWGNTPLGYHLANALLHASAACLFALTLRRLLDAKSMAEGHERRRCAGVEWIAAFVFALHPVHVESVAWISEQKNTLSTIFYLGATLAYLRFDAARHRGSYALALALFVAALLSKSVTATLPAALLVVLWWQRGQLEWRRDVVPLVPWFAIGILAGLHTAWLERTVIGAEGAAFELNFLQRTLLAGHVIAFDLGKLLWPANLTFIYPRWTIDPASPIAWLPLLGVLGVTVALWVARHRSRAPLAAWLLFAGSLFPVLGFFNVFPFQYSFVADHFQYLASLGAIALAGAALARLRLGIVVASVLVTFGLLTWRQAELYRDSETLFRATLARNPACWMAANNLGRQLARDPARLPEAIALFERSLALHPQNARALSNFGLALVQSHRAREAIPVLEHSLRLDPKFAEAHNNHGIALAGVGRLEEAVAAFARAAQLNPNQPDIHDNWARVCQGLGDEAGAAQHFAEAARLRALAVPAR